MNPVGVAVDGAGNVSFADRAQLDGREIGGIGEHSPPRWLALGYMSPVAWRSIRRNVYIADTYNEAIEELPRAFVDPGRRSSASAAGTDALPVVLPATANLSGLPPSSDQSWLTITSASNGIVLFSFTADPGFPQGLYHGARQIDPDPADGRPCPGDHCPSGRSGLSPRTACVFGSRQSTLDGHRQCRPGSPDRVESSVESTNIIFGYDPSARHSAHWHAHHCRPHAHSHSPAPLLQPRTVTTLMALG